MQESTVFRSIWRDAQQENTRMLVLNLLRKGVSLEIITRASGLSLDEVQQIQQQLNEPPQYQP
ncbi:MAG: hypothetical protein MUF49_23415 [Oculatellaceae cyanobacterium Prado106]|jgi:hypothetical protein|nr:hypothetical protein [Oculatellaceae cyanobacterium Prado106]